MSLLTCGLLQLRRVKTWFNYEQPRVKYQIAGAAGGALTFDILALIATKKIGGGASSLSVVPAAENAPQLSRGAQLITDLVGGPGKANGTLNKSGALVITGERFKFRVDLKQFGNDASHMRLQERVNGRWRDAVPGTHRIYPKP